MTPAPALSAILSVYNAAPFLAEAIESILAQSVGDFEFLIVDDGSEDGSADIAAVYAAQDPRIRLTARENRGFIPSLNEMIAAASAPLIARMDADDISHPRRFERQLGFIAASPEYGVVGTWNDNIAEDGAPIAADGPRQPLTHEEFLERIGNGPLMCHPAVIMRRDALLAVGGYHRAFVHCEDFDLWLRLSTITKIGNVAEELYTHRHYATQVSERHAYEQRLGAAIALAAWHERLAGRPDPTASLERLPPLNELDALFGRPGVARTIRERVAPELIYAEPALAGPGLDVILDFVAEGGNRAGMWRTVARLLRMGRPLRAARLALALAA